MNKKQLFYKFLDYNARINRGAYWITLIEDYIPFQQIINLGWTSLSVYLIVDKKPWWMYVLMGLGIICIKILSKIWKWTIATIDYKFGIWRAEIDWNSKNEKYNTLPIEMMKTVKSIAEKLEAKNHIKDLEK